MDLLTLGAPVLGLGQGWGYTEAAGKEVLPLFFPLQGLGQVPSAQILRKKDLVSWEALKTPPLQRITAWGWGGGFPGVCPPSNPSRCACCWGKGDRPGQQPQTLSPVPLPQPWTSHRGLCAASSYLEEIYKPLSTGRTLRGLLRTIDQPRLSAL